MNFFGAKFNKTEHRMWGTVFLGVGACLLAGFLLPLGMHLKKNVLATRAQRSVALSARSSALLDHSHLTQGLFEDFGNNRMPYYEPGMEQWQKIASLAVQKIFPDPTEAPLQLALAQFRNSEKSGSGDALVITRGQFLDLVSNKRSTTLPTRRAREGILLYSLSKRVVNPNELKENLDNASVASAPLCQASPESQAAWKFKRVTLLTDNEKQSLECLTAFLKNAPSLVGLTELSVVVVTPHPQFYASARQNSVHFSVQQWHPDWILKLDSSNSVANSESADLQKSQSILRAQKLALLAKALTSPSDVQIEVPVRQLKISKRMRGLDNAADSVQWNAANDQNPLIFGNLVLLPLEFPQNPVRATRMTAVGTRAPPKPALGLVYANTRALIVTGTGNSFRFDAEVR